MPCSLSWTTTLSGLSSEAVKVFRTLDSGVLGQRLRLRDSWPQSAVFLHLGSLSQCGGLCYTPGTFCPCSSHLPQTLSLAFPWKRKMREYLMVIQQANLGLFGWELGKNGLVPPDTVRTVGGRVRTLVEAIFLILWTPCSRRRAAAREG